jgi:NADH-quinone oxidoreductase subunit M
VTPGRIGPVRDLSWREKAVVAPLIASFIIIGFFPKPVLDVLDPAVERTLQYVGVTDPAPDAPADAAASTDGSNH